MTRKTLIQPHAGHFLSRTLARINIEEPKTQKTILTELEADLKAWQVARKVLGNEVAERVQSSKAA